jgi:hypothetical protein
MMRIFLFSCVLFLAVGFAETSEVYFYRVEAAKTSEVETVVRADGKKSESQPYLNTHVLTVPDTGYNLVTLVPLDGVDKELETKESGVKLWKVIRLDEDGFFRVKVDNSALFPVNRDWSVKISS